MAIPGKATAFLRPRRYRLVGLWGRSNNGEAGPGAAWEEKERTLSGVLLFCVFFRRMDMAKEFNWHIEWRDPNDLTPYGYNAKLHDPEQVKNIANSISRFGWQQPAVATKDGTLIIGHGRRLAAIRLGVNMPVKVIEDELSDTDIRELRIADNKTNESPWDFELLREEIKDLDFEGFDFDMVHETPDIDQFFQDAEQKEKEPKQIQCPHCGEWFEK